MEMAQYLITGVTTPVTICPIGDIQWGGDRKDLVADRLVAHITRCLELPNPLFVGMGDYIDFASPSNREALKQARIYDTARKVLDDATKKLVHEVFDNFLAPTRGKWLGLVEGHHHYRLLDGRHSDQYLCELLAAPWLTELGIVNVQWKDKTHTQSINIVVFHGDGQSVFPHGPLVKTFRVSPHWDADVILMGHQTRKAAANYDFVKPIFTNGVGRLDHLTRHLIGTGGWSKGYVAGRPTYVSKEMYPPVALGQPIIHVRPAWHRPSGGGPQQWESNITVEV